MTPFLGEIAMVGFTFAPVGWAFCSGQLLPIGQNAALFTLLGTTYGGDGVSTFGLPNLQSRVPLHLSNDYALGEQGGVETVTLTGDQLPSHAHLLLGASSSATSRSPSGMVLAMPDRDVYNNTEGPAFAGSAIGTTGGDQPHSNIQPYLAVSYVIALVGIFAQSG